MTHLMQQTVMDINTIINNRAKKPSPSILYNKINLKYYVTLSRLFVSTVAT